MTDTPSTCTYDHYGFKTQEGIENDEQHMSPNSRHKHQSLHKEHWSSVIENWDSYASNNRDELAEIIKHGIPDSLRQNVWPLLANLDRFGSPQERDRSYRAFLDLADANFQANDPTMVKNVNQIKLDLPRTFYAHIKFQGQDGPGRQQLFDVLRAFSVYHEAIGYCQGMSFIAGVILMYVDEPTAFWIMASILRKDLDGFFEPSMEKLKLFASVFDKLLDMDNPEVFSMFEQHMVHPLMYLTNWILSLFTNFKNWSTVMRIWDTFLFGGQHALYKVSLGIIRLLTDSLKDCQDQGLGSMLPLLLKIPVDVVTTDALMDIVFDMNIDKEIAASKQLVEIQFIQEQQLQQLDRTTRKRKRQELSEKGMAVPQTPMPASKIQSLFVWGSASKKSDSSTLAPPSSSSALSNRPQKPSMFDKFVSSVATPLKQLMFDDMDQDDSENIDQNQDAENEGTPRKKQRLSRTLSRARSVSMSSFYSASSSSSSSSSSASTNATSAVNVISTHHVRTPQSKAKRIMASNERTPLLSPLGRRLFSLDSQINTNDNYQTFLEFNTPTPLRRRVAYDESNPQNCTRDSELRGMRELKVQKKIKMSQQNHQDNLVMSPQSPSEQDLESLKITNDVVQKQESSSTNNIELDLFAFTERSRSLSSSSSSSLGDDTMEIEPTPSEEMSSMTCARTRPVNHTRSNRAQAIPITTTAVLSVEKKFINKEGDQANAGTMDQENAATNFASPRKTQLILSPNGKANTPSRAVFSPLSPLVSPGGSAKKRPSRRPSTRRQFGSPLALNNALTTVASPRMR